MTWCLLNAIAVTLALSSCQKSGSDGGSAGNQKPDGKEEGSKGGVLDQDSEIAIVSLTADLGECNAIRKGKSFYVLTEKKFRYCSDAGQWDALDLRGASGVSGKSSLVSVTAENTGTNCVSGGHRIQSGLDSNGNKILDAAEVTANSYACHGEAGRDGVAGSDGKPSLVAVTAEVAGLNCSNGGHNVRSGIDVNGNGVLDDSEVVSSGFVCHGAAGAQGAQGVAGASGSNGKNALIKTTAELAGSNCASGGRKIEFGNDLNGDGELAVGEVSGSTYVCNGGNGAAGAVGPAGTDGADGDRYVGRVLYTATGTRLGVIVKELDYLIATSTPPLSNIWVTPDRLLIILDSATNRHVGYVSTSKTDLNPGGGYTQVSFRSRRLEEASLTKLGTLQTSVVYANAACDSNGAFFAYNMAQSYKPNSGARQFNNRILHDFLVGLGLTMVYNFTSQVDIMPNCASPSQRNDIGSHNYNGQSSCETLCKDMDVGCSFPAIGEVCTFTTLSNVFPDTIAAGWYVQKN
jgi:hypothetical protein